MTWNPEECVTRGATYLDENFPEWWFEIDLSKLNMSHCKQCIIGQAVCEYWTWQERYSMTESQCKNLGFDAPYDEEAGRTDYKVLDELWTDVVKERFNR